MPRPSKPVDPTHFKRICDLVNQGLGAPKITAAVPGYHQSHISRLIKKCREIMSSRAGQTENVTKTSAPLPLSVVTKVEPEPKHITIRKSKAQRAVPSVAEKVSNLFSPKSNSQPPGKMITSVTPVSEIFADDDDESDDSDEDDSDTSTIFDYPTRTVGPISYVPSIGSKIAALPRTMLTMLEDKLYLDAIKSASDHLNGSRSSETSMSLTPANSTTASNERSDWKTLILQGVRDFYKKKEDASPADGVQGSFSLPKELSVKEESCPCDKVTNAEVHTELDLVNREDENNKNGMPDLEWKGERSARKDKDENVTPASGNPAGDAGETRNVPDNEPVKPSVDGLGSLPAIPLRPESTESVGTNSELMPAFAPSAPPAKPPELPTSTEKRDKLQVAAKSCELSPETQIREPPPHPEVEVVKSQSKLTPFQAPEVPIDRKATVDQTYLTIKGGLTETEAHDRTSSSKALNQPLDEIRAESKGPTKDTSVRDIGVLLGISGIILGAIVYRDYKKTQQLQQSFSAVKGTQNNPRDPTTNGNSKSPPGLYGAKTRDDRPPFF